MIAAPTLLAVLLTAFVVWRVAALVFRPTPRLPGRVRPYTVAARASFGRAADPRDAARATLGAGPLRAQLRASAERFAARWGRFLDGASEDALLLKLRQAGLLTEVAEERRIAEYRIRQFGTAAAWGGAGAVAAVVLGHGPAGTLALLATGLVAGAARSKARLDRALEDRRDRMRIELYTVNQLLAMNIRVGGGVVQAVRRVIDRGHGAVVTELTEVLRAHGSGVSARDAFLHAAATTPDPSVARTYRLLAAGTEYGTDLAGALLDHSEDLREARRESLRRSATRRRAATLLPIIGILAPVMLLFVAAPLPSIVFSLP